MANYAFFRPTRFTEQSGYGFDEFVNSSNAYDIGNDTYCKTDTDGKYTNRAFGSGLVFVPNSQTAPYKRHIDFSSYSISESLPQGAVIVSCACGLVYSNRVGIFGNKPNIEIGVTRSNSSTDTSFFDAYGSYNPGTGNTDLRGVRSSWTVISDVNTVINQTASWLKNNAYLMYTVNGKHSLNTSSTVIYVYEIFAFCRWKLPFRISLVNGSLGSGVYDNDPQQVYEYNAYISRFVLPNEGYSGENPIITFSQGNPSYTYNSSSHSFSIPGLQEGVNVKIEFRKERSIYVDCNYGGTVTLSTSNKVPDGTKATITATSWDGYKFVQWSDGDNKNATRTVTVTSDITYTATFAPITYSISFNGNGSTHNSMNPMIVTYDNPSNLSDNNFKRIGYLFKNWNTKADGTGTSYSNKATVNNWTKIDNDLITLYAQWEFVGDINYDNLFSLSNWYTSIAGQKTGQGGTVTADLKAGTLSISCPSNASSPDNNICAWDYDIPLQAGESYIFEYDTTIPSGGGTQVHIFYMNNFNSASWLGFPNTNVYRNESATKVQIPFTLPTNAVGVNFRFGTTNEKGITNTLSNMKLYKQSTYNSSISKINNYKSRDYIPDLASVYSPSKTGYDFNGWTRNEGGSDSLTLQGIKNFTQSTTVYSKWTPYNYYIEFNGNGADNTGTMSTQTFTYDQSKNLTQNGFSRYRHEFVNWNTKADGTGQSYENNSEILNLTAEKNKTIVLYAQWKYTSLGQSIFVKNIPVKKILIDSDEVIEVFTNKAIFFRSLKEE